MCRFGKHVKGFYRIPREELWYCMRKHVMKYLIVVQDTEPLLAVVMDSLADEVRQESLLTVMFAVRLGREVEGAPCSCSKKTAKKR